MQLELTCQNPCSMACIWLMFRLFSRSQDFNRQLSKDISHDTSSCFDMGTPPLQPKYDLYNPRLLPPHPKFFLLFLTAPPFYFLFFTARTSYFYFIFYSVATEHNTTQQSTTNAPSTTFQECSLYGGCTPHQTTTTTIF